MEDAATPPEKAELARTLRALGLGALFLAGIALALWSRFGSAVFMDMLATAWAYCF